MNTETDRRNKLKGQMTLESQANKLQKIRGFVCVGLFEPKNPTNTGCVLRAAGCFGVDLVGVQGQRYKNCCADTQKAWKHIPLIETENLALLMPKGCVGVAVDIVENAMPLPRYVHPERAFYVFGGEDRTLDERVFSWCRDKVYIPSLFCLNLAAAVNVVLYDRQTKIRGASQSTSGKAPTASE